LWLAVLPDTVKPARIDCTESIAHRQAQPVQELLERQLQLFWSANFNSALHTQSAQLRPDLIWNTIYEVPFKERDPWLSINALRTMWWGPIFFWEL
jgi:hypothetical protein